MIIADSQHDLAIGTVKFAARVKEKGVAYVDAPIPAQKSERPMELSESSWLGATKRPSTGSARSLPPWEKDFPYGRNRQRAEHQTLHEPADRHDL